MTRAQKEAERLRHTAHFFDELRAEFEERFDEPKPEGPSSDPLHVGVFVALRLCETLIEWQERADQNGGRLRIPKRRGPGHAERVAADLVTSIAVQAKMEADLIVARTNELGSPETFTTAVARALSAPYPGADRVAANEGQPARDRTRHSSSSLSSRVLGLLEIEPRHRFRVIEIALRLGEAERVPNVRAAIQSLYVAGRLRRVGRGFYRSIL